jgi:hypothetical protein
VRSRVVFLAMLLPLAFATGCGESAQAKAEKTVCEGKKEIGTSVDSLKSMTLTTASASTVQNDIKGIEAGLRKVKGAQGQLSSSRREAAEKANAQMSAELSSISHELSSLSLPGALTKVLSVGEKLAASYKTAFAPVEC